MKVFTIDETNNITVHASVQDAEAAPNADRFRSEAGLEKVAADWPMVRLVAIWNGLPGVAPVTKFKDRATAVSRIWKAVQILGNAAPMEASQPRAETLQESDLLASVIVTEPIAAEPEVAEPAVDTHVAPQAPDVAPSEPPATKKATRAKKTPGDATKGEPREGSKTSQVVAMLKREGGASLEEIMAAMGWQKHTTRAMLSAGGSLTKNHGLVIISEKVGDHRRYSIKT